MRAMKTKCRADQSSVLSELYAGASKFWLHSGGIFLESIIRLYSAPTTTYDSVPAKRTQLVLRAAFSKNESARAEFCLLRWGPCRRLFDRLLKVQAPFWSGLFFYAERTLGLAAITHAFQQ